LPVQIWELTELVCLGCPQEALKVFRKGLIGRGNPLTARQADAAISSARQAISTGRLVPGSRNNKRAEVPETPEESLTRLRWYVRTCLPVVVARPRHHEYTDEEAEIILIARDLGCDLTFLEWDDEGVDRIAAPDLSRDGE
jgi:hypothetical protein